MNLTFEITEIFEVSGRGLVIALPVRATELPHKTPLSIVIHNQKNPALHAEAFHELILRKSTGGLEISALLLPGVTKAQVPIGATLQIIT